MLERFFNLFMVVAFAFSFDPPRVSADEAVRIAGLYDLSIEELMGLEVTTGTRKPMKMRIAPSNIKVVTREQIKTRRYVTLLDLLEDMPEVQVYRYNGEEEKSRVVFRGHSYSNYFIVLLDGEKISSATGEITPMEENFPLFMAKQVEILFGPASAVYGQDALAGVINIITAKGDTPLEAGYTLGSDSYGFGYAMGNLKLPSGGSVVYGIHYHRSENQDLSKSYPEHYPISNKDAFGTTVIPAAQGGDQYQGDTDSYSIQLDVHPDDSLSFGFRQRFWSHLSSNGNAPSTTIYDENIKWETLMRNLFMRKTVDLSETAIAETSVSYNSYELLPSSMYQNMFVNYEKVWKYARDSRFKFDQNLALSFGGGHDLLLGISYEDFYALPKTADLHHAYNPNIPAAEQGFYHFGSDGTIPMDIYELRYQNLGYYAQATSEWSDTFSTIVGARFDDNTRYGNSFNPRGGIVYSPSESTTYKLLYGESFLAPAPKIAYGNFGSFSETSTGSGIYQSFFFHMVTPDLKPEKARYTELVATTSVRENMVVNASLFRSSIDGIILPEYYANVPYQGANVITAEKNVNKGLAQINGVGLNIDSRQILESGNSINWWAGLAYTDGWIDDKSGIRKELPFVTRISAKGGFTWSNGTISVSPRVLHAGTQNHIAEDPNDPAKRMKVKGYTIVDLTVRAENIFGNLSVTADIRNLFDTKYYQPGGNSGPTASFVSMPQDRRSIFLGLEYGFDD